MFNEDGISGTNWNGLLSWSQNTVAKARAEKK
jgi:hypothetical protein